MAVEAAEAVTTAAEAAAATDDLVCNEVFTIFIYIFTAIVCQNNSKTGSAGYFIACCACFLYVNDLDSS